MAEIAWQMVKPSAPLEVTNLEPRAPGLGEAWLRVAGCGICHTDIGFLHGGVRTRHPLPLTLGHEIAARVEAVGPKAIVISGRALEPGDAVVVPAVLPCGKCDLCLAGRDNICLDQKMPGNDLDGGFATHVMMPARYLVPADHLPPDHELRHLAVVADAVTTPFQALHRARVAPDDFVVVVGVGGVGIYGVQIATALEARVLAVDIDPVKVEQALAHGAEAALSVAGLDEKAARKAVSETARKAGFPAHGWKIFEMSGTAAGQRLAYSLLSYAGTLGVVGYTRDKVEVRLSNLMAFDADVFGSWGCSPRHYSTVLDWIAQERIQVKPFVSFHPLSEVNAVLEQTRRGEIKTRPVLVPER